MSAASSLAKQELLHCKPTGPEDSTTTVIRSRVFIGFYRRKCLFYGLEVLETEAVCHFRLARRSDTLSGGRRPGSYKAPAAEVKDLASDDRPAPEAQNLGIRLQVNRSSDFRCLQNSIIVALAQ